ncbi:GNAT family N-acetyltransferase [Sanguibacter suaedae]|uniref:GNAT family N-acetyltransferase n=1 Tax=Sanguibacter suaedae TaxID=2795737 RepID=A0A934I3F4_9MICO|nr:GNAT family N-acetyltransferase [Sanguibacter suaedae]MBI9113521.1 GNAT family N-acetyltransferase [Sanguibacter suaedae]
MTGTPTAPGRRFEIRPARTTDPAEVDHLYEVCLRTGADGEDASALVDDPRLLGELYLGAYLALEPDLAFVLDDSTGAVGYVVGTSDTAAFDDLLDARWWPALRARYPLSVLDALDPDSMDARLVRLVHTPGRTEPHVVEQFPAHLHVDVLPVGQGGGNGRRLLDRLFDALRERDVPGVHLGVSPENRRAIGFYEHLGFQRIPGAEGVILGLTL